MSPWRVEKWSGGEGHRAGFYVARTSDTGSTQWLQHRNGRPVRYETEADARRAAGTSATLKGQA